MTAVEITPFERHLRRVRGMGLARVEAPDYRLYERPKAEFVRDFPAATPQEYERAMRVIAEAAGV